MSRHDDGNTIPSSASRLPTSATSTRPPAFLVDTIEDQATYSIVFTVTDDGRANASDTGRHDPRDRGVNFDGDGKSDVLWHNQPKRRAAHLEYFDGTVTAGGSSLTPKAFADTKSQIRRSRRFRRRRQQHIYEHHQGGSNLYVWSLDGTVTSTARQLCSRKLRQRR